VHSLEIQIGAAVLGNPKIKKGVTPIGDIFLISEQEHGIVGLGKKVRQILFCYNFKKCLQISTKFGS